MAALVSLQFEFEPFHDAFGQLVVILGALPGRHGQRFRVLEREVESVLTTFKAADLGHENLGEGIFVLTPPATWVAVIRKARAMGVIGQHA